jgi:hypothetical protein
MKTSMKAEKGGRPLLTALFALFALFALLALQAVGGSGA